VWRPANVATTGVATIASRGQGDNWSPESQRSEVTQSSDGIRRIQKVAQELERAANLEALKAAMRDDAVIDGSRAVMKVGLEKGADPREVLRRALGYVIMRAFGQAGPIMESVQ
jgi:hypothetical protein